MTTPSNRHAWGLPLGNENFTRAAFNALMQEIDADVPLAVQLVDIDNATPAAATAPLTAFPADGTWVHSATALGGYPFDGTLMTIRRGADRIMQSLIEARTAAAAAAPRLYVRSKQTDADDWQAWADATASAPADVARLDTAQRFTKRQAFDPDDAVAGLPYSALIDEATTNAITNPSFEVDTAGWGVSVGSPTLARQTAVSKIGVASGEISIPAGATEHAIRPSVDIPAAAGQTWTLSLWLRTNIAGKVVRVVLREVGGTTTQKIFDVVPGLEWTRYTFSWATTSTGTTGIYFTIGNNDADQGAYIINPDAVQLEQKGYATTYADGSLGPGYVWTGTAHASTSTRTAGLKILGRPTGPHRFVVGSDGRVLSFAGARVYQGVVQPLTTGTETVLTWDSETHDTNAFHDPVVNPSRITIPAGFAGYYRLKAQVGFATNSTGTRFARLRKNGTTQLGFFRAPALSGQTSYVATDVTRLLAAGDYVEVVAWQDSGGNLDTAVNDAATFLEATLEGTT